MELKGSRVLVTGASRGIGAALAHALAREGARLVLVARSREALETVARACGAEAHVCDVGDDAQVQALARATGPVDVLVNNAAVIHKPAPLVKVPHAEWERVLRTNVLGVVSCMRAYLPAMEQRGAGAVVNLSSGWGRFAAGRQAPYCASKFAVEALSAAAAEEVAPGVCIVAVNPGVVVTDMLRTSFDGAVEGYTPPAECAEQLVRLLRTLDESWNGRSLDAPDF